MVRFVRPAVRRRLTPTRPGVAALAVLALGVAGLSATAQPAAAAGDDLRANLPGAMAEQTVIAASGTSLMVSFGGASQPDRVSTDNGAHFATLAPPAPAAATIVHAAHGAVTWQAIDTDQTTLYTYDFAGGTTTTASVAGGTVEAADARTAVFRTETPGQSGGETEGQTEIAHNAQDLASSEVHQLAFTPAPTGYATAQTTFAIDDGSLVLAATTTTDEEGRSADGYLDLLPITGEVSPLAEPELVPGLVSADLRGDQVVYVTATEEEFSICFRELASWAEPSCQPFTVAGLDDPRTATAPVAVGADWVLVTPRWGAGSQEQLVVAGTTAPEAPVAVVRPNADRVLVFTVGDSERPLASVWKGNDGYIGQVGADGRITRLFTHPTAPVEVAGLRLTPDRLTGLDGRGGNGDPDYQAWQRPVSEVAIESETLFTPRAVSIGASAARVLLDDGTKLRLFDAGVSSGTLTPPKYGANAESLSGPYFYGRTVAYDQVVRVDGVGQRKGQVRALFGSTALMLTNASLNRYDVADVTSTDLVRVEVPAAFDPAHFDGLGLWGDYVLGFSSLGTAGIPTTVVLNYRTHESWSHVGYPIEIGDGFVVLEMPADADDPNQDDELATWNFLTTAVTRMPDRDWLAVASDGSHRVAYSTGSQLVVRPVDGAARSAPRVLGVLAPSGLNLITGADTWTLALDASKALSPGTLTIENGTGAIVRTEAVPGAPDGSLRGISWDGKYVSGEPVVPGSYRWTLTQGADDGSGNLVGVDGTAAVGGTINVIREPLGTLVGSVPTLSHKTPVVGQTLSVAEGTWSPSSGLAFTYNWFRSGNGAPIGTGKTYQVTPADLGKHLRAAVTGKVEYWAPTTTVSAYSSTVGKGTLAAPKPTIDNPAPKVGQVLTAQPGTWAPAGATLSYRWYKVSSSGRSTYLKGKVAQTLTVTGSLVRYRLKVKVTGRLAAYDTRSVYSSRTSKVARA